MKEFVIVLPTEAYGHLVNAICSEEGFSGDIADQSAREAFAQGWVVSELLRRSKSFNIKDQTAQAILAVQAAADQAEAALLPYVSVIVRDVES